MRWSGNRAAGGGLILYSVSGVSIRHLKSVGAIFSGFASSFIGFVFVAGCSLIASAGATANAQGVVPDRTTSTSVTTATGGKITVTIAPPKQGISLNRYSDFNVPQTGVDLNNSAAKAGTIVNEVTSTRRSQLVGPLSVTGQKANVIVANPNGITVNGASFANTGAVGLLTGRVSTNGDGKMQIDVTSGDISVGSKGLSAALDRLDLIAKNIKISGPIVDTRSAPAMALNITSGSGRAALDGSASATDLSNWLSVTSLKTPSTATSIVIESGAVLNGGTITITANDKGAGVNVAGKGRAAKGDYWITGSGKILVDDVDILAEKAIFIAGKDIAFLGSSKQSKLISTSSGILIEAEGNLSAQSTAFTAQIRTTIGFSSIGAVMLSAEGDITFAKGKFGLQFTALDDALAFDAAGRFADEGGVYKSPKNIFLSAGEDLDLVQSQLTSALTTLVDAQGDISFQAVKLQSTDSIVITGKNIEVASSVTVRSEVKAEKGGVYISAEENVVNRGALVQGSKRIEGVGASIGGVSVVAGGGILNETTSEDRVASFFGENDDLTLRAGGSIRNASGRFLSNKSVLITTDQTFDNSTLKSNGLTGTDKTVKKASLARFSFSAFKNARWEKTIDYGSYVDGNEISNTTAVDTLKITAKTVINVGGELASDDINITAQNIVNKPALLGRVTLQRRCKFFIFCRSWGNSTITRDGGAITATNELSILASTAFVNLGGTLSGSKGIAIKAPKITLSSQLIPNVYTRPAGFMGGLVGSWGRFFYTYDGGALVVAQGDLTLESESEVVFDGTTVVVSGKVNANHGTRSNDAPAGLSELNRKFNGLFRGVL